MAQAATVDEQEQEAQQTQLPGFEGIVPTGATISFTGSVTLPTTAPVVGPDEVVYFLVEAQTDDIDHKKMARTGWTRRQNLAVSRITRVNDAEAMAAFGDDDASVIEFSTSHRNDDLGDELSGDGAAAE